MTHDYDLFVIGGGSGGVRAARMAGQRGAKVTVAEAAALGGTCVNVGCIPKKLYSYAAHFAQDFEDARGYGWDLGEAKFDWNRLRANRSTEISRLNGVYQQLLEAAGVEIIRGWAQVCGPHTVEVDGRKYTAKNIVIATGGTPNVPKVLGHEHVVTSDHMFDLTPFPKRLLIVGGGYIACEFASIFNGLGAKVTLIQRASRILSGFDQEVSTFVCSEMGKTGVDINLNSTVSAIVKKPGGLEVTLAGGAQYEADVVLYAVGRTANTNGLGLEKVGVKMTEQGAVVVDGHYRSSVPSIFALGDVSTSKQLTPVALAEAMVLVDHLFGPAEGAKPKSLDYEFIPTAVFTHPNVGTVGYTEAEAKEKFGKITIFRSEFKALKHTLSGNSERTLMKLVVEQATDRVVGLHMVGPDAGEIVQGFAVAMKAGATKAVFDGTVGIHPTAAEEFVTMRQPARMGD